MDGLIIVWVSAVAATAPLRHVTMAVAAAAAIFMGDGTEFWEWGAAEGGEAVPAFTATRSVSPTDFCASVRSVSDAVWMMKVGKKLFLA